VNKAATNSLAALYCDSVAVFSLWPLTWDSETVIVPLSPAWPLPAWDSGNIIPDCS